MSLEGRAIELNQRFRARVASVQLLGEVELTDADFESARQVVRDVERWGFDPMTLCPDVLATLIVIVARRKSEGLTVWPFVQEDLGLNNVQSARIGQWFEGYLVTRRLPNFQQLVDQGAMRYRSRILAHALVPLQLVPRLMESVVWPSVTRPETFGATADEVQQRLIRAADLHLSETLERFLLHGGPVARDLLDRLIVFASAMAAGEPDTGDGLPRWLQSAVEASPPPSNARLQRTRFKPPVLEYQPGLNRLVVGLPYQDQAASAVGRELTWWAVVAPAGTRFQADAMAPVWSRSGPREEFEIEAPFDVLQVELRDGDRQIATWNLPSFSQDAVALFFAANSGRARQSGAYLEGSHWYVLRPKDAALSSDGEIVVVERLGSPAGEWTDYVCELVQVNNGTNVIVSGGEALKEYRLVSDLPRAMLAEPVLPGYLASLDGSVIAFETRLPGMRIPGRHGDPDDRRAYLHLWQLIATNRESGEQFAASPSSLGAAWRGGAWHMGLESLIPGEDVGSWDLNVRGPLGQGLTVALSLLPAMEFSLPDGPRITGSRAAAREVQVLAPGSIEVLEGEDSASCEDGIWTLTDRNRNGRIPFTVRDNRTERHTTALLQLPTVAWAWKGAAEPLDPGEQLGLTIEELKRHRDVALRLTATGPINGELQLVGPDSSRPLQSLPFTLAASGRVSLNARDFIDSIAASPDTIVYFQVRVFGRDGRTADEHRVGAISQRVQVEGFSAAFEADALSSAGGRPTATGRRWRTSVWPGGPGNLRYAST